MKVFATILLLTGFNAHAADVEIPGFEKVDYVCTAISTCHNLPEGVSSEYALCEYKSVLGYESSTGKLVTKLYIGGINPTSRKVEISTIARESDVARYDLSDIKNVIVEPANFGPIAMKMNLADSTGSFRFRVTYKNGGSWKEFTGATCN